MATAACVDQRPTLNGFAVRARWCTVEIETDARSYVGTLYVPETRKRLSDVLCDDRPFLSLVQVAIDGSGDLEPYVAINKNCVRTVRIVHEGDPDVTPVRHR